MRDRIDLEETVVVETLSNEVVAGVIVDQITITEQALKVYTTKNGSPWQQKDSRFLEDCILHENVDEALSYAESHFCTIICVEGETIKWSGGPAKAKSLFVD